MNYIYEFLFRVILREHLLLITGFLTFSPTWNSMIKTLSIGRMDNFKTFFMNGNSCENALFSR